MKSPLTIPPNSITAGKIYQTVIEKERGNLKGAEARLQGALQTVQGYGDRWGESIFLNNLGDLALTQEGGLDRAEGFYRKALALREAIGDENGLAVSIKGGHNAEHHNHNDVGSFVVVVGDRCPRCQPARPIG